MAGFLRQFLWKSSQILNFLQFLWDYFSNKTGNFVVFLRCFLRNFDRQENFIGNYCGNCLRFFFANTYGISQGNSVRDCIGKFSGNFYGFSSISFANYLRSFVSFPQNDLICSTIQNSVGILYFENFVVNSLLNISSNCLTPAKVILLEVPLAIPSGIPSIMLLLCKFH